MQGFEPHDDPRRRKSRNLARPFYAGYAGVHPQVGAQRGKHSKTRPLHRSTRDRIQIGDIHCGASRDGATGMRQRDHVTVHMRRAVEQSRSHRGIVAPLSSARVHGDAALQIEHRDYAHLVPLPW